MLCMTCHGALLFSLCAYCSLWSVSLWISVSLLKCWRIIKLQWSGIFSPTFEMERAALKCTEPWTNWWVLAHEIWKSTSHLQVGVGKQSGFSNLEFLRHLYPNRHVETCQRERHSSERWLLGSSCLDETQCMKTTWWPFGDRYVFLAAAVKRSWQDEQCGPLFELLVRGKTSCLKWGPWEHMKRLLWTYWSYCKKRSDVTWLVGALW